MTTFKKIVSVGIALFLSLYCLIGFGNNVSDDYKEYKNVILMIGDGTGDGILAATKQQHNVSLTLDTMPVKGHSDTRSFLRDYTDSAAGGSALACGIRIWANSLALFPFYPFAPADIRVPVSLTEVAKANGMAAGVVTTDKTSGATPASFSSHVLSRDFEEKISKDQLKSDLDLIWGGASESITPENCEEAGFTYVSTLSEFNALSADSRSFAQFDASDLKNCKTAKTPSIIDMTKKAISILNEDEDGFFLMVEGACIDKFSHSNDFAGATMCAIEFDKAVAAALEFAKEDGDTLVVVTADHETGGVTLNEETGEYYYTTGDHTTADVPVFVSATDAGFTDGCVVENRQISVQIARVLGFDRSQFPAVKGFSIG